MGTTKRKKTTGTGAAATASGHVAPAGDLLIEGNVVPQQRAAEEPARSQDGRPANWTRLGDLLVSKSRATRAQVAEALLQQSASGKRLGQLLVELGALSERGLAETLSEQYALPLVDLRSEDPEPDAPGLLPEGAARALNAIPLGVLEDGALEVAVSDPGGDVLAQLESLTGKEVALVVASQGEIRRAIDTSYRALTGLDEYVAAFQAADAGRAKTQIRTIEDTSDEAPVVQIVQKLLTQALRDRASDVHLEPQDDRLRVRFRIDGALHDVLVLPSEMAPAVTSRIKIMGGMNIVERRRPQDGQITAMVDGHEVDIRVSTTGVIWGEKVVLRILDKSRRLYALDDLGMPKDTHETFSKLIRAPFGMVLCAGPTGSGKTTTLYASLNEINEPSRNIMTIEDPVEYVFPSINQIQTNEQAGLTFATGLKSMLRQDPDVMLVGEIRDIDTARIATQSALTGHFVLSSLHATDAVSALHRFLDMGIESFLIASSVLAVVGQRLVRRSCDYCKAPYQPTDEEIAFYVEAGGNPKKKFTVGEGCNVCSGTGYADRIGVYELLRITPEIKRLIVGWATTDELRRMAVSQGMHTLQQEAMDLIDRDVTTISEVVRAIYSY